MTHSKRKKRTIWLSIIAVVLIGGFFIYKTLFPTPITELIPNPVSDKATLSKDLDESNVATNELRRAYFGDLHVHTSFSFDAYIGGTRTTPDDAYRFAQGEEIDVLGQKARLQRPLDFAAVTDHSEFLGELYSVQTPGAPAYQALFARYFRSVGSDTTKSRELFNRLATMAEDRSEPEHLPFFQGFETTKSAWDIILEAAEKYYRPGKFTTFAAYEWTMGSIREHVHRNIIFKNMVVPDYPISSIEVDNAGDLFKWIDQVSQEGSELMSIPHNTNLSNGGTFPEREGEPMTQDFAKLSNTYDRLIEIHQAKGNSEVHPALWQNDEFADFETYTTEPLKPNNFVRHLLKKGLEHEDSLGINPYKFGIIGSTDTHNGVPGNTEEDDEFIGNHTRVDLTAASRKNARWVLHPDKKPYETLNPGGLVAVWADANTRGHIYDAMQRRETFATSGGRIQVRFFGGYGFSETYEDYEKMVRDGYIKGVPMGSDLPKIEAADGSPSNLVPEFIIWAAKDPLSANLDRIQVVKGWYQNGELHEKIFNVALSDNRVLNADGSVPDNGATVNMETGEWSSDKGAVELMTVWSDPEFDPNLKIFYYLRVLELPTASWRLWDKIRDGIDFPEGTKLVIRERAWSSPIWFSPS